jgi:hypothetical protein
MHSSRRQRYQWLSRNDYGFYEIHLLRRAKQWHDAIIATRRMKKVPVGGRFPLRISKLKPTSTIWERWSIPSLNETVSLALR